MSVPVVILILARIVVWLQEPATDGRLVRPSRACSPSPQHCSSRIALGYRDALLIRELYAQRAREQEASHLAQQEAARLQGVVLTGRELSHLLSNDLAMAVGWIDYLREHPDLPPDLRDVVDDASVGLERAVEHLKRLQQVNRVAVRETPLGPALDLAQSVGTPDTARPRPPLSNPSEPPDIPARPTSPTPRRSPPFTPGSVERTAWSFRTEHPHLGAQMHDVYTTVRAQTRSAQKGNRPC